MITEIIVKIATIVISRWSAPKPKPIEMMRNIYANSSGSLIAARNRIIDSAPTNPSESAKDDLTIVMINVVVIANTIKLLANILLLESELP